MLKFKFPDVGEGLTEGKVLEINVKEGDAIKDGEVMFSVETDKINAEIPSPCNGVVKKINMKIGDVINVGDVVIEIDDGSGAVEQAPAPQPAAETSTAEATQQAPVEEEKTASVIGSVPVSNELIASRGLPPKKDEVKTNQKVLATPVARKMASDMNVDLSSIHGSGPNGRVLKADILQAKDSAAPKPASQGPHAVGPAPLPPKPVAGQAPTRVAMTGIRKAIAKQMMVAKDHIPATTLIKRVDVTELIKLRNDLKPLAEKYETKITFMPFFIKACQLAIKDLPIFNSQLDEEKNEIIYFSECNIGMAVDAPNGLVVPVIKNCEFKNILEIAREVNELADKARHQKLQMSDMKGATFTISNFGSAGIEEGTPVINYPEVAILGVGTIKKEPVVLKDDSIVIRSILPLSLTIDHRLIDGADAGRFLMRLNDLLDVPTQLLLG